MTNAIVGQSGGPTAAINATLSGVVKACRESGKINALYGSFYGIQGVLNEKICNLFEIVKDDNDAAVLELTPAAALGSCRKKLPSPDSEDCEIYKLIFDFLKKKEIKYFFYIGGNDSMDTVYKLSVYGRKINSPIRFIGVPKTIDNDLPLTDHAPGFASAAKYLAISCAEMIRDTEVYNTDAVTIIEIMGRDAGWLTASSALSRIVNGTSPDLVYLPEVPFSRDKFISDVRQVLKHKHNAVIAVSEGIKDNNGNYICHNSLTAGVDVFGHKALSGTGKELEKTVREKIGCKARSVEINILQRCASHTLSKTDITESVMIGKYAVKLALSGISGRMPVFKRLPDVPYKCVCDDADLSEIANSVRNVPLEFINDERNNVTDECLEWILPLIQGEIIPIYKKSLPVHFVIDKRD